MHRPKALLRLGLKPISLNCCPKCSGEGRIWDFGDPEEPIFYYCDLCRGEAILGN